MILISLLLTDFSPCFLRFSPLKTVEKTKKEKWKSTKRVSISPLSDVTNHPLNKVPKFQLIDDDDNEVEKPHFDVILIDSEGMVTISEHTKVRYFVQFKYLHKLLQIFNKQYFFIILDDWSDFDIEEFEKFEKGLKHGLASSHPIKIVDNRTGQTSKFPIQL